MSNPEADIAAGVQTKWEATSVLTDMNLWRGRIKSADRPAMPYATVTVSRGSTPNVYMAPNAPGGPYLDYRSVEISIYCRADDADDLTSRLDAAFCHWPTLTVPNSVFRSCRCVEPASAILDPATRSGEDVWKVHCRLEVLTQRTL